VTRIRLSPAARRDIAEIWLYTADRWGADQADRYVRQIELDLMAAADGLPLARALDRYWRMKSGHHVCVFRKLPAARIDVLRILHERMDVPSHIDDANE
jgi:toxin ParE1/3/4